MLARASFSEALFERSCRFRFEVVNAAGDGESVVGYQMYTQEGGGRGAGKSRDSAAEVRLQLFCAVGFP